MPFLTLALALAVAPPWLLTGLHNRLVKSSPSQDESVRPSPAEIRLWFAEPVLAAQSRITLTHEDKSPIAIGPVRASDDRRSIAAEIATTLSPGRYQVAWEIESDDGEPLHGKYWFQVAQGGRGLGGPIWSRR
jgi:methionine-rich copper-binding protein CopC